VKNRLHLLLGAKNVQILQEISKKALFYIKNWSFLATNLKIGV
jgi:hypothetical protein